MEVTTGYRAIKPKVNISELEVICTNCTKFKDDTKKVIVEKIITKYDGRNELFRCPRCNKVYPEKVVRYYLKLDLPEYVHYEDTKPVKQVLEEREEQEKFILEAINQDSPITRKKRAVKIK